MKWLPPPSVPSWCTQLDFLPMRFSMPRMLAEDLLQLASGTALAACERASRSLVLAEADRHVARDLVEDLLQRLLVELIRR